MKLTQAGLKIRSDVSANAYGLVIWNSLREKKRTLMLSAVLSGLGSLDHLHSLVRVEIRRGKYEEQTKA